MYRLQIGLFCFVGVLFQVNCFTNSIEEFFGFWVHIIDIIIYRDILRDKLQQMTLNQYLAPIISLCATLSIACLIIGSHSMDIVKISH